VATTLVTGGSGFAGSHLIDRLAGRGRVIAWRRSTTAPADPRVDWAAVDLLDARSVGDAVAHAAPDVIYHLAGAPQVDSSWQNVVPHLALNALGTHHLLSAVRRLARPCRVLVVSSAQIYQPGDDPIAETAPLVPPSPYGLSKLAQDQLARHAASDEALDVVLARPFNHAGPRQEPAFALPGFARQIARIEAGLQEPVIRVGNLEARRDLTDVRDVVDAYLRIVESAPAGRPYNVCSGRAWRIGDLLDELLLLAKTPVTVESDAARLRPNDVPVIQGNAGRLRAELAWTPQIPIEQTISDTLDDWRRRIAAAPDQALGLPS
jgi:GDP-4-dehydro-6-deoxy-D-mannose reductase